MEVLNSEKIILLKNLLKENICCWKVVGNDISNDNIGSMEVIKQHVAAMENEIQETVLSKERYITKLRKLYNQDI